jgi:protein-S-isoprenylcysteine O-methyltransferase Ste14
VSVLYLRATLALALPAVADVVVPVMLLRAPGGRADLDELGLFGIPLVALGGWLLLDTVFVRFAHEGRGTLAPIDPPRRVVRGGAYRLVRNPMYVANVAVVAGEAILFGSWYLLAWAAALFGGFHTFVIVYEEPTLRRRFGESYDAYRREVNRWVPRFRSGA